MNELWDIYDVNKNKLGRTAERDVYQFKEGEYHIVVTGIIMNSENKILISKRAGHKKYGGMWECSSGSILAGETSLEGIIRELKEELGLEFSKKEAIFLKEIRRDKILPDFKDLWLFRKDVEIDKLTFPDGEVTEAKWVTIQEFIEMVNSKQIIPTIDFGEEEYMNALEIKQREAYSYIGNSIKVKIDRKLGSMHPKHGFKYLLNYGYIPNTMSDDGEEIDCYVLGVNEPIEEFEGQCIAVIHRLNDDDDKIIVVPNGMNFSDSEIKELTNFQEKYFVNEIIR